jgi:hypothetical protein
MKLVLAIILEKTKKCEGGGGREEGMMEENEKNRGYGGTVDWGRGGEGSIGSQGSQATGGETDTYTNACTGRGAKKSWSWRCC